MNELTIHGNVTADVEFTYSAGGTAWTRFTVAINRGRYDNRRQWVEEPPVFMTVVAFNQLAENASGLVKGTAVTATGQLADDSYTPEGSDRKVLRSQLRAADIAVSLRHATVQVTRNPAPAKDREQEPVG